MFLLPLLLSPVAFAQDMIFVDEWPRFIFAGGLEFRGSMIDIFSLAAPPSNEFVGSFATLLTLEAYDTRSDRSFIFGGGWSAYSGIIARSGLRGYGSLGQKNAMIWDVAFQASVGIDRQRFILPIGPGISLKARHTIVDVTVNCAIGAAHESQTQRWYFTNEVDVSLNVSRPFAPR